MLGESAFREATTHLGGRLAAAAITAAKRPRHRAFLPTHLNHGAMARVDDADAAVYGERPVAAHVSERAQAAEPGREGLREARPVFYSDPTCFVAPAAMRGAAGAQRPTRIYK